MNCSEYLARFLAEKGVTDVFGYPGGYIVPFMDALDGQEGIEVHLCYNEQGCSFAANGYARVSGKLGVFFTTSGPGAVNALGGLADAWFDGIPVMGICGNSPNTELKGFSGVRQIGFQEMDIVSMTRGITKYSATPKCVEEFPSVVEMAYNMAISGRKGGVVIDFPFDIEKASIASR